MYTFQRWGRMIVMNDSWYALHVRPRFESTVETQLEGKGYEVFLPTYEARRRWSDRVKIVVQPLFPGYVFCRFNVGARLPILTTPGVNSIIGVGKIPVPVDQEEISAIRSVIDSGIASYPCDYIRDGESVRVESGPLEGLVGIVQRSKNSDRLVVSLTLLMRSVSVEIDRSWVKRVGTTTPPPVWKEKTSTIQPARHAGHAGILVAS
jgi:transcription antitermination factor NusG